MLDGTVKTVMVDDAKIVSDMLMTICARIGQVTWTTENNVCPPERHQIY